MYFFDCTQPLPTYVYSFSAGPFLFLTGEGTVVPMRVASTNSSLMIAMYSDFIFDVTTKAMSYMNSYFGVVFPFTKYDMVWVRDFEEESMQNPGLSIFDEGRTLVSDPSEDDYYNLAKLLVQ